MPNPSPRSSLCSWSARKIGVRPCRPRRQAPPLREASSRVGKMRTRQTTGRPPGHKMELRWARRYCRPPWWVCCARCECGLKTVSGTSGRKRAPQWMSGPPTRRRYRPRQCGRPRSRPPRFRLRRCRRPVRRRDAHRHQPSAGRRHASRRTPRGSGGGFQGCRHSHRS